MVARSEKASLAAKLTTVSAMTHVTALTPYLHASEYIDHQHPLVAAKARELALKPIMRNPRRLDPSNTFLALCTVYGGAGSSTFAQMPKVPHDPWPKSKRHDHSEHDATG